MLTIFLSLAYAEPSIVFVGNSYTQSNNLHVIATGMLGQHAKGWESAQSVALVGGGLTLADHSDRVADETSTWYTAFHEPHDLFILQDQSQIPGFPQGNGYWQASLNGLLELQSTISQQDAMTMLLMTWGRQDGDSQNPDMYPDFETMQELLSEGYLAYAEAASTDNHPVYVAPIGPIFGAIKALDQELFASLYSPDGSHPSATGSATVALGLYASISGRSVTSIPTDLSEVQQQTIADAIESVILQTSAETYPLPWIWTDVPSDGIISSPTMRPLLRLSNDHSANIEIQDGRLWLEEGHLEGTVTVANDGELLIKGGQLTGNIEGDVTLLSGELYLSEVSGSLWQTGGTLIVNSLLTEVGGDVILGTIDLAGNLEEGYIQAASIDISNAVGFLPDLGLELTETDDGDTLHLFWVNGSMEPSNEPSDSNNNNDDPIDNDNNEEEKNTGCASSGLLPFMLLLGFWHRKRSL